MAGEPVVVASCETVAEAETLRGLLLSEGIPSFLADPEATTVLHVLGERRVRVAILVATEDAGRAAEALRPRDGEAEPGAGEDACVSCGALFPAYLERCPACGLSYG